MEAVYSTIAIYWEEPLVAFAQAVIHKVSVRIARQ